MAGEQVQTIEKQILALSPGELAEFREWFAQFDGELWDRQMEADAKAGRLDAAAERALRAHRSGQSTKL